MKGTIVTFPGRPGLQRAPRRFASGTSVDASESAGVRSDKELRAEVDVGEIHADIDALLDIRPAAVIVLQRFVARALERHRR
jgi:hypothetical protein